MKFLFSLLTVLSVMAFSRTASAQMIVVPNASFETPGGALYVVTGAGQGAPTTTNGVQNVIPGWTFVNNEWSGTYAGAGETGTSVAFINTNFSGPASITSTNPVTAILAGTDYLLTVGVGNPPGTGSFAQPAPVTLNLLANSTAAPTVFSIVATNSSPINALTIPDGTYKDFTVDLTAAEATALAGDQLEIQMAVTDPANAQYQTTFDNVRLSASAVPEPSVYAMMFAGLALLASIVRLESLRCNA